MAEQRRRRRRTRVDVAEQPAPEVAVKEKPEGAEAGDTETLEAGVNTADDVAVSDGVEVKGISPADISEMAAVAHEVASSEQLHLPYGAELPLSQPVEEKPVARGPRGPKLEAGDVLASAADLLEVLLNVLADGSKNLKVRRDGSNYILQAAEVAPKKKPTYREQDFWSDEYREFITKWRKKTPKEKLKAASESGVSWQVIEDPKVNVMRATVATQTHLGIEKYRPGFQSRAARLSGVPE